MPGPAGLGRHRPGGLLIAAAEPIHDPVLVWRAAGQLGVEAGAAAAAAAAGFIESGRQIRFCHPLARSVVYRLASVEERRRVHLALAQAIDPGTDPDRRAWHRAHAAPGLDEGVAAELTPGPARRARRALAAAQAKYQAGAPEAAGWLLGMALAGPLGELGRARAELLGAQLAADADGGHGAPSLLEAAKRLEPLHPRLARETYRDAFGAALAAWLCSADCRKWPRPPWPHRRHRGHRMAPACCWTGWRC